MVKTPMVKSSALCSQLDMRCYQAIGYIPGIDMSTSGQPGSDCRKAAASACAKYVQAYSEKIHSFKLICGIIA